MSAAANDRPEPRGARALARAPLLLAGLLLAWLLAAMWMLPAAQTAPALNRAAAMAPDADSATRPQPLKPSTPKQARAVAAVAAEPLLALRSRWQRSSLRGAALDGALVFDAAGRLALNAELRRRFEHYLALLGEFSPDELKALLLDDVRRAHGDAAAASAQSAFERYLGFRQASSSLPPGLSIAERHAALQALRHQWFGEDASALFGDETDYDTYTLERMQLAALPADQREAALAELAALRPTAETAARAQSQSGLMAEEQTRQFDALGLDPAARAAEREALWGSEAASRLAQLDQQREAWDQRLRSYAAERNRLSSDARLDAAQRSRALQALLNRSFAGPERVRVQSLQGAGLL